jgi:nucleoside-diphosphate-sugar epimerase
MNTVSYENDRAILLTGGTGYLGALIAATLLSQQETTRIVALVRQNHTLETFIEPIRVELASEGKTLTDADIKRITLIESPEFEQLEELTPQLKAYGVEEIIHSAGCVDYFNTVELERVNIIFTQFLLKLAARLSVRRFIYLSTAYSCGYTDHPATETLHGNPKADPTEYTRTKREAEREIAESGIPFLIIRPSIIIGHSKSGRYSGKRYGLYQQWMGVERLLCDRYHPEYHVVAPHLPLNFVHQDVFQSAFDYAYTKLSDNTIMHMTSSSKTSPTVRDLWDMWMKDVARPQKVFYYPHLAEVPLTSIHPRQRAYLMFASTNLDIAAHHWVFETPTLDQLRGQGLNFQDATLETIALGQQRFIQSSERIQKFITENRMHMPEEYEVVEITSGMTQNTIAN